MFQQSLFSKLYSYRERENKNSKENFLIEILAHCLDSDDKLSNDFFELLELEAEDKVSIKTQSVYDYGRPDIEINFPNKSTCILIECKIEHFERANQLEDYKKILESKKTKNKHLVYLTKYYDLRENHNKKIKFHPLRWQDVYELIDEENTELSKELKQYIKDENMSHSKNFNYTDLAVLKSVTNTIHKMDEVLDRVKEFYEKKIGKLSKDSSRSSRIQDEWYINFQVFRRTNSHHFEIDLGFFWWDDDIYLGARVHVYKKTALKNSDIISSNLKKTLKDWEIEDDDDEVFNIGCYKALAKFIIDEEEQIPAMVNFLKEAILELEKIKKVNPIYFRIRK